MVSYQQYEAIVSGQDMTFIPEELFGFYVETLRKKQVVKNPDEFKHLRKFIPMTGFFILVPGTRLSLNDLMERVELDGRTGRCFLDEGKPGIFLTQKSLTDMVETFNWHYLCRDVDDGRAMAHVSPRDTPAYLQNRNRSGYVAKEGIFHLMYFPDVLKDHCMDVPGSRYFKKFIPRLYIYSKRPLLYTRLPSLPFATRPKAGAASCGSRIAF